MLLELAIADAYGAGFEYAPKEIVKKHNNLTGYIKHQFHDIPPGNYTDDTQMSIAVAELIISKASWEPEIIANKFIEVFKRDPRLGYASRFYDFLQSVTTGKEFIEKIHNQSDKSGAAMRATPLGYLKDIDEILFKSSLQAQLTHNTDSGIKSAQASSLIAHYFIYNLGPKNKLGQFLETYIPPTSPHDECSWDTPYNEVVKAQGWMSTRAAITALKESQTLSQLLKRSVDFTGDVDTVATIALGAGSNSPEIKKDLPQVLIDNLENNQFGKDYLIQLDQKLKV